MKAHVEDAIEQIATAELLNMANTSTGERLALIICDNAVEYMMIAFIELEKLLVHKTIKAKDWEQKKQQFHELLGFTVSSEGKLAAYQGDIQVWHNIRNKLYHTGIPLSVKAAHVTKYLNIAKTTLGILFGQNLSSDEWAKKVATVNQVISRKTGTTIKAIVRVVVKDNAVQVEISTVLKNHEILCVVLDAFATVFGKTPTIPELEQSLALSHAAYLKGPNLSKRIYDCRKKKFILKDMSLTPKGQKLVAEKTVRETA